MKVYNKEITQEITDYDSNYGKLIPFADTLGMSYREYLAEYANFDNIVPHADDMIYIPFIIYDETKTILLEKPDLTKGRLKPDRMVKEILPAQEEVEEQGHYEIIKEYPNGGKDVEWVVDVEGQPARKETPVYENIQVYIPYTKEEILEQLRERRRVECFSVVDKGFLWYSELTDEQIAELKEWRSAWKDVPNRYLAGENIETIIPTKPSWLN